MAVWKYNNAGTLFSRTNNVLSLRIFKHWNCNVKSVVWITVFHNFLPRLSLTGIKQLEQLRQSFLYYNIRNMNIVPMMHFGSVLVILMNSNVLKLDNCSTVVLILILHLLLICLLCFIVPFSLRLLLHPISFFLHLNLIVVLTLQLCLNLLLLLHCLLSLSLQIKHFTGGRITLCMSKKLYYTLVKFFQRVKCTSNPAGWTTGTQHRLS